MAQMPQKRNSRSRAMMLGLGLDSDGHKRVTQGPNFLLAGGTKETHETMTEKAIKINEKLTARGKSLDTVGREEFDDIAQSVGLRRPEPKENSSEGSEE
jgi:BMFP domain-containing protein YqiC